MFPLHRTPRLVVALGLVVWMAAIFARLGHFAAWPWACVLAPAWLALLVVAVVFVASVLVHGLLGVATWVTMLLIRWERWRTARIKRDILRQMETGFYIRHGLVPADALPITGPYRPLPADHPSVRERTRCPLCRRAFAAGDVTCLRGVRQSDQSVWEAELLHHACALVVAGAGGEIIEAVRRSG